MAVVVDDRDAARRRRAPDSGARRRGTPRARRRCGRTARPARGRRPPRPARSAGCGGPARASVSSPSPVAAGHAAHVDSARGSRPERPSVTGSSAAHVGVVREPVRNRPPRRAAAAARAPARRRRTRRRRRRTARGPAKSANASTSRSNDPYVSMCSRSMFVTTAIVGDSFRNDRSLSSASTTMYSPRPEPRVAAERAQPAADDRRRVESGPLQHQRHHRRRRRLAVRAGDRDAERAGASARRASRRAESPGRAARAPRRPPGCPRAIADETTTTSASPTFAASCPMPTRHAERRQPIGDVRSPRVRAAHARSRDSRAARRCRSCRCRRSRRSARAASVRATITTPPVRRRRASSSTRSTIRAAASGRANVRIARAHRREPRSRRASSRPTTSASARRPSARARRSSTAAPRVDEHLARSCAGGRRSPPETARAPPAGPSAASSASVVAPARQITRSAALISRGDGIQKGLRPRRDAGARVAVAHGGQIPLAGLVDDFETGTPPHQLRRRRHHGHVDRVRALGAAKDQHPRRARLRRRTPVDVRRLTRTPRRTGLPATKPLPRKYDSVCSYVTAAARTHAREQPIGQARHGVLLEHQRRNAAQRRGEHDRTRAVAADANHDVRPAPRDDAPRVDEAERQRAPRRAAARRSTCPSVPRCESRPARILPAARRAPRGRAPCPRTTRARRRAAAGSPAPRRCPDTDVRPCRRRQSRSTSVACRRSRIHASLERRHRRRAAASPIAAAGDACCEMFSRMPIADQIDQQRRSAVAHERQRNALGRQQGRSRRSCSRAPAAPTIVVSPSASSAPNRSGASSDVAQPAPGDHGEAARARASCRCRPSSSPMTAKMKSVCGSGR